MPKEACGDSHPGRVTHEGAHEFMGLLLHFFVLALHGHLLYERPGAVALRHETLRLEIPISLRDRGRVDPDDGGHLSNGRQRITRLKLLRRDRQADSRRDLFVERHGASWVDGVEHEEGCLVKCIGVLIH